MKKIFIIILNKAKPNSGIQILLEESPSSIKLFENTWLLSTTHNISKVYEILDPLLDKDNERILISELNRNSYQGWISRNIWDWIKKEMQPPLDNLL